MDNNPRQQENQGRDIESLLKDSYPVKHQTSAAEGPIGECFYIHADPRGPAEPIDYS